MTVCFSWFDTLKLPPPIWTLIYIVLCSALSWSLGWPTTPGLPLPLLGIVLVALAFIPPVWAFILFRREDTEIDPTSLVHRKLVTRGPYQFTRNPMYLGLVTVSLGIAVWIGTWPMFMAPLAAFATVHDLPVCAEVEDGHAAVVPGLRQGPAIADNSGQSPERAPSPNSGPIGQIGTPMARERQGSRWG